MQRSSYQNLQDLLTTNAPLGLSKLAQCASDESLNSLKNNGRLIMVANMLPLKVQQVSDGSSTPSYEFSWDDDNLLNQAKAGIQENNDMDVIFIGQLGVDIEASQQEEIFNKLMSQFNCAPVFMPEITKERFYKGMCKQIMWPLFHYVLPMSPSSQGRFDQTLWQAYIAANKAFTDRVVELLAPDHDFVWIHDYHLLLMPTLLRKRFHTVRMGFFLHCPFPSSEMFRAFPMRAELLRGLLNADLVGFHTFDYARHFLSCCSRMLGLEFQSKRGSIELEYFGRRVRVRICPMGIQVERLRMVMGSPEAEWRRGELIAEHRDKTVILGVDDMDPFKGIDLKCQAMEALLRQHPELIGRVVLIQVAHPARMINKEVVEMREQVLAEVGRINARFAPHKVIELLERNVPLHERTALYSVADCVVVAATRDGMNLIPYEYVVCRQGLEDDKRDVDSMLVVSEFVGCTPSLSGALRVNPWNVEDMADSVYRAITIGQQERLMRHEQHYRYIKEHSVEKWACSFLSSLQNVAADLTHMMTFGLGFGLSFRVVALPPHFQHLNVSDLVALIPTCESVCFLLDYDGTLTQERGCSLAIPPSEAVLTLMQQLCAAPSTSVCIVSGRSRHELHEWLHKVPNLGIAAEHGCFYRPSPEAEWQQAKGKNMLEDVACWKEVALPILESYAEVTDGSFIQEKESAVVWHFNNSDPDFGQWQSKELVTHLEDLLVSHPVDVYCGNYTVEIKPKGINKAIAVEQALQHMHNKGSPADLIVCIGDDRSDEEMFQGLRTSAVTYGKADCKVFSATVGQKPSTAPFFVNDQVEVIELLQAVVGSKQAQKHQRSASLPNPPSLTELQNNQKDVPIPDVE